MLSFYPGVNTEDIQFAGFVHHHSIQLRLQGLVANASVDVQLLISCHAV
jgi:hypothetical protein